MGISLQAHKALALAGIMALTFAYPATADAHGLGHKRWKKKNFRQHKKFHNRHRHGHRHYKRHDPYLYGSLSFPLPRGFIKISVGGKKYHYHEGAYYRKRGRAYEAVHAPIGACIRKLPHGYVKIIVDGHVYYEYNNVYYKHTRDGYEVIEKPYSKRTRKHERIKENRDDDGRYYEEDKITLSIRTKDGGRVTISVTPSGDGFIGPQGEYYEEFPKIDHLRAIYGS